jgi:hypothetical protein
MAILKFDKNETKIVLTRDHGIEANGKYGRQFVWECGGGDDIFYASEQLHGLIKSFNPKVGDSISIKKVLKEEIDGSSFEIFAVDNGDGYKTFDDIKEGSNESGYEKPSFAQIQNIEKRLSTIVSRLAKVEEHCDIDYANQVESNKPNNVSDDDLPF